VVAGGGGFGGVEAEGLALAGATADGVLAGGGGTTRCVGTVVGGRSGGTASGASASRGDGGAEGSGSAMVTSGGDVAEAAEPAGALPFLL
jgi:hypothetical protein